MTPDATVELYAGESVPVFASLSDPTSGAAQITAPGTVTLYDAAGSVAGGVSGAPTTGHDAAPGATARAWYVLDSAALALPPGAYRLVFTLPATDQDGLPRAAVVVVAVTVAAPAPAAPDRTAWPGPADVQELLDAAGTTPRAGARRLQRALDAAVGRLLQETGRNFTPVTETRYYDGLGTSEIEADEMVSLTSVAVVGSARQVVYQFPNAVLVWEQQKPRTRIVASTETFADPSLSAAAVDGPGGADALGYAGAWTGASFAFPCGRQNVAVTGLFAYGATIPVDVWEAVCKEAAYRVAQEAWTRPTGRVSEQRASDGTTTHFALDQPSAFGWHDAFTRVVRLYREPAGRKFRAIAPRVI